MNSMLGVLARIPLYQSFRALGCPGMLPIDLTLSPAPRCNFRGRTCNIWKKREGEPSRDEWEKVPLAIAAQPAAFFTERVMRFRSNES